MQKNKQRKHGKTTKVFPRNPDPCLHGNSHTVTADENSLQLPPREYRGRAPSPCVQRRERAKACGGKSLRGQFQWGFLNSRRVPTPVKNVPGRGLHVNAQIRRRDFIHKTSGIDTFALVGNLSNVGRCLPKRPRHVCPAHVFASLNGQQRAQPFLRSPILPVAQRP